MSKVFLQRRSRREKSSIEEKQINKKEQKQISLQEKKQRSLEEEKQRKSRRGEA